MTWRPPYEATERVRGNKLTVGDVVAHAHAAWEVTHIDTPTEVQGDRDLRATFHRVYGPRHDRENEFGDMIVRFSSRAWDIQTYPAGRVWLCSCCGHPVPCRMAVAEKQSARAAAQFEQRLKRMGPGICYACGEVITQRQDSVRFPGDHADFPGRPAPAFHTRRQCLEERTSYARRAGLTINAEPKGQTQPAITGDT